MTITDTAMDFFDTIESGRGWDACKGWCHAEATFSGQCEPLVEVTTVEAYAAWMQWLLQVAPDGRYELKAFATDSQRNIVCAFAVFHGTHTGEGGPVPPTGKSVHADYVYAMEFDGTKIRHVTSDLELRLVGAGPRLGLSARLRLLLSQQRAGTGKPGPDRWIGTLPSRCDL